MLQSMESQVGHDRANEQHESFPPNTHTFYLCGIFKKNRIARVFSLGHFQASVTQVSSTGTPRSELLLQVSLSSHGPPKASVLI